MQTTMLTAEVFLFKIFSTIFAFSIIKIIMQGQQLCQANYIYLFLLFQLQKLKYKDS